MAIVPKVFGTGGGILSQSFNWFDFATGTGYRIYYPCASALSGSTLYFLTPQKIDSTPTNTSTNIDAAAGWTINADLDFDLLFNSPVVIKGTALINVSTSNGISGNSFVSGSIYHVTSGGTETLLGSAATGINVGAGAITYFRDTLKIPLTMKGIGVGESLRVSITHYAQSTVGLKTFTLYHDPNSRNVLTITVDGKNANSDLIVNVPFRVDL